MSCQVKNVDFRQALAFCQLSPGPLAAQLAIYLGWLRSGVWGGTLTGIAFILPSFLMVVVLAALYGVGRCRHRNYRQKCCQARTQNPGSGLASVDRGRCNGNHHGVEGIRNCLALHRMRDRCHADQGISQGEVDSSGAVSHKLWPADHWCIAN